MMFGGSASVVAMCGLMASYWKSFWVNGKQAKKEMVRDESEKFDLVGVCGSDGADVVVSRGSLHHSVISAVKGGIVMVQVLDGTFDFEVPGNVLPSVLLQPWLAFGSQVTVEGELTALGHAIEAVNHELQARFSCNSALWWMHTGQVAGKENALGWFQTLLRDLHQASWH
jgi:hypothetical protein